jgi:energy-coupling factor transporter ATP-binding protein EcfA2
MVEIKITGPQGTGKTLIAGMLNKIYKSNNIECVVYEKGADGCYEPQEMPDKVIRPLPPVDGGVRIVISNDIKDTDVLDKIKQRISELFEKSDKNYMRTGDIAEFLYLMKDVNINETTRRQIGKALQELGFIQKKVRFPYGVPVNAWMIELKKQEGVIVNDAWVMAENAPLLNKEPEQE